MTVVKASEVRAGDVIRVRLPEADHESQQLVLTRRIEDDQVILGFDLTRATEITQVRFDIEDEVVLIEEGPIRRYEEEMSSGS